MLNPNFRVSALFMYWFYLKPGFFNTCFDSVKDNSDIPVTIFQAFQTS